LSAPEDLRGHEADPVEALLHERAAGIHGERVAPFAGGVLARAVENPGIERDYYCPWRTQPGRSSARRIPDPERPRCGWDPERNCVAPFSAVKSSSAHINADVEGVTRDEARAVDVDAGCRSLLPPGGSEEAGEGV